MNGVTIIHAAQGHLDVLAPLFDQYRQFYGQSSNPAGARTFLAERIRAGDSVIFLALDGLGKGLGFVQLYPSFSSVSMERLWILNDLFVEQSARRKGVAEALIRQGIQLAKETNSCGLVLETAGDNLAAQQLYEKLGWKQENEFRTFRFDTQQ